MDNQRPKYIAEGFEEDSGSLLNEFVDLNTVEFSEFAAVWRKHKFSLIFMGRPDQTETTEFVNEMFTITSQYLFSPSFYQRVGAVYLLYSLFRNQISEPKIKIRLELSHWKVIKSLRVDAMLKKYKTLELVINYLISYAFLYVANQTLRGPLISCMTQTAKTEEASAVSLKTTYKSDIMKYSVNNTLAALRDLQVEYLAEQENFDGSSARSTTPTPNIYEEALNELHQIVNPSKKKKDNLGTRRAKIKAESFMRKSKDRLGVSPDSGKKKDAKQDPDYRSPKRGRGRPRTRRPRRPPKHERKVGRPRKHPKKEPPAEPKSDDDVDISHLLPQQKDFYLPPVNNDRKTRTKRDAYYRLSPKREESDSDPESSE